MARGVRWLPIVLLGVLGACASRVALPDGAHDAHGVHLVQHAPGACPLCDVAHDARSYVVRMLTQGGLGAGVIVSTDGHVVSNAHVVGEDRRAAVEVFDGRQLDGAVLATDVRQDLALLRLADTGPWATPLIDVGQLAPVGSEVYVIGHPSGLGWTVSRGIVSGYRVHQGVRMIQTDAAISPGNSGGAMLDRDGHLIGIVTSKILGQGVENVAFARPASDVLAFLQENEVGDLAGWR